MIGCIPGVRAKLLLYRNFMIEMVSSFLVLQIQWINLLLEVTLDIDSSRMLEIVVRN